MIKNSTLLIILFSYSICGFSTISKINESDKIIGMWISPQKDLIVSCYKENDKYYGKIAWFKRYHGNSPDDPNGQDESTWMNSIVMKDFVYDEDEWNDGKINDIKSGKNYSAFIKLTNDNQLHVTGFILFRFLCKTTDFSRYTSNSLPPFL